MQGDLLIQVYIEVPTKIKPEHEAILRELAKYETKNGALKEQKSFGAKLAQFVKDFFPEKKPRPAEESKEKDNSK